MTSRVAIFTFLLSRPQLVQMVKMPLLLTTVVVSSRETCLIVVGNLSDDDETSFRLKINSSGQQ